jgi:hypothetical protein
MHSGSIIIMKIYPAISAVIGGRDGMDYNRHIWMMCSINRTPHQSWHLRIAFIVGDIAHFFFMDIYIYMSSHNISMPIPPFSVPQGKQEWVDGIILISRCSYPILS